MNEKVRVCCSICPYYEECGLLSKTRSECCQECPDYEDCEEFEEDEEELE